MEKRLAGWKRELLRAHGLIAELFARSEPRARSLAYLQGLLSGCERKNGWQLAEWMGEAAPYAVQHLLDRALWDVERRATGYAVMEWKNCTVGRRYSSSTGPGCGSPSRMAGRGRFWCGAVSKNSPSTPTISVTLPPGKTRWRRWSEWPDNAGKSSNALRLPRANADWITTRFATGKVGTGTSRWPCWPMLCCRCCAHVEKKTPNAQVRLSVPELRHLLTALLWRGWHGIEHLLHWSHWRRQHQFHAMTCHYRKRGSTLSPLYPTVVLVTRLEVLRTPLNCFSAGWNIHRTRRLSGVIWRKTHSTHLKCMRWSSSAKPSPTREATKTQTLALTPTHTR